MWKARLDNTFWVLCNSLLIWKSNHHCINKQTLHIFQHLRERQGEIENRIPCITSQEASMVQWEKTSKCGQKSYFMWKLHFNFPIYIYAVLDLVAARTDLKNNLPKTLLPSSYLPCSQPGSMWSQGVYFPFLKTTPQAFKKWCWTVCLPGVCFPVLSDTSTKAHRKAAHRAWTATAQPDWK